MLIVPHFIDLILVFKEGTTWAFVSKVHMIRAHDDNDVIDQVMWVVYEGALTEHAQLVGLHGW